MQTTYEGVEKNIFAKTYLNITEYTKIKLKKSVYNLVIEGIIPFTFPDGKLDLDVYSMNDVQLEQLEFVEPVEYTDKYIPSKVGLIFSERIFVNELTAVSFSMSLVRSQVSTLQAVKDPKKPQESL